MVQDAPVGGAGSSAPEDHSVAVRAYVAATSWPRAYQLATRVDLCRRGYLRVRVQPDGTALTSPGEFSGAGLSPAELLLHGSSATAPRGSEFADEARRQRLIRRNPADTGLRALCGVIAAGCLASWAVALVIVGLRGDGWEPAANAWSTAGALALVLAVTPWSWWGFRTSRGRALRRAVRARRHRLRALDLLSMPDDELVRTLDEHIVDVSILRLDRRWSRALLARPPVVFQEWPWFTHSERRHVTTHDVARLFLQWRGPARG